ncbi:hypothetical protein Taro_006408, partial [Colocasia esculenta]|nr:hypothetical protein [Colocasia esculenta]
MLSRRLQRILAKKKKFQSSKRYFKKNKDFKKPKVKDLKKGEPICYECKKPDTSRQSVRSSRNHNTERRKVQENQEDSRRKLWKRLGITVATRTTSQARVARKKKLTWINGPRNEVSNVGPFERGITLK